MQIENNDVGRHCCSVAIATMKKKTDKYNVGIIVSGVLGALVSITCELCAHTKHGCAITHAYKHGCAIVHAYKT